MKTMEVSLFCIYQAKSVLDHMYNNKTWCKEVKRQTAPVVEPAARGPHGWIVEVRSNHWAKPAQSCDGHLFYKYCKLLS